MKNIFAFLCSLLCAITLRAQTVESGTTGTLSWEISNGTLTISGTGAMPNYSSDVPWYSHRLSISRVVIGEGVTNIGNWAFYACSSLTSVSIPNSIIDIGNSAFSGCYGLTAVMIPNSVTNIGNEVFLSCHSLASVSIPNSVIKIGNSAFGACSGLISIDVESGNPNYSSENGVLFNKDKTQLLLCPHRKTGMYTIPNSVTTIGNRAFEGCSNLNTITIPNSLTIIGDHAFRSCSSLTSVMLPNSITIISAYAFEGCSSLTSIVIPNSVIAIGNAAFGGCSKLVSVIIPDLVTNIGSRAFEFCSSLNSVTIGKSVTSIGGYAFAYCTQLMEIVNHATIPQSIPADVFTYVTGGTLYVPIASINDYRSAPVWKDFMNIVEIGHIWVDFVRLNQNEAALSIGDTKQLTASVVPDNATNKVITWRSSNSEIATVSAQGLVAAVAAGTAIVSAISQDGGKIATCIVTIIQPVTNVNLNKTTLPLIAGDTEQLTANIAPANATNKTVTWNSSNTAVATVNTYGLVTAVAAGTATITVITQDGNKTANCTVTVTPIATITGVMVSPVTAIVQKGKTQQFTAMVEVTGGASTGVVWSLTGHVLTTTNISASGILTVANGETASTLIVTATSVFDNTKRGTATVTVENITSVEIFDTPLVSAYPNPTGGLFTLNFSVLDIYRVIITDMAGKVLFRQMLSDQTMQMDIGNYPSGVYLLMINDGKRQSVKRIVKN